ncbi:MAG TPA: DegT/DnrJ/EryC1/StrS family aminotransferase [Verrucomicrobiae bacterium]|nr:DegT/DnrJ/EryC1/StrS family aminotransferase [Verrucomicrobiae bacterium]
MVPLLDVNAQNGPLEGELKAAFDRVLKSGQFIMGPDIGALESEISEMAAVKHAIGVSSGTDAILLALMALGVKSGDEVLCPSFTFFATAGCIARAGATPVFVDVDPLTFNLDLTDAAKKVTRRTKAIIPVHLFGQCADMDQVVQLAQAHGVTVIEDAAQSLGATYRGRAAGAIGSCGAYSFFPSKNLGGLGDAGMLVCNEDTLAEKARLLRTHGANPKYYHKEIGGNFRLDSLQAAFLRVKLAHYGSYNARRRANAAYYTEKLSKLPGVVLATDYEHKTGDAVRLVLPTEMVGCNHIWNQYTVRIPGPGRRDIVRNKLADAGVSSEIYYPIPLHKQECFAYCSGGQPDSCPVASRIASEVLSIPIYPELTKMQVDAVVAGIGKALS